MTDKKPIRSCFGDYPDCPCDDECVVSKECEIHANLKLTVRNSCGLSDAECSEVEEWRKQEHHAALKAERERVLDDLKERFIYRQHEWKRLQDKSKFTEYNFVLSVIESLRGEP